ncbi:MAG: Na+/H+ antiporter NhaC family protein, partial [Pseudomonadota bacterium]|nr:Na+/H+ antiporter NhaC family protein [Pseudomonadota bacterium]
LHEQFRFNLALLITVLIVLFGTAKKWPTIPVLLLSICSAVVLAIFLQGFPVNTVLQALVSGVELYDSGAAVPDAVIALVERGGIYSMKEAIFVALLVFLFVGAIDLLNTMPRLVETLFGFVRGQKATVVSALFASATTNALTSNQSATAFIVGDAFAQRFDNLRVPRRVLSRSIEDTGTMIESIIPWHATALFMSATLGVSVAEYWYWQVLTLANLLVAPVLALTGIGCNYGAAAPPQSVQTPEQGK